MSSSLPGDPTPGQLAAADRKHAAVSAEVDKLVARLAHDRSTEAWIRFTHGPVVDAADRLTGSGDVTSAALGLAGEALLRLAGLPLEDTE